MRSVQDVWGSLRRITQLYQEARRRGRGREAERWRSRGETIARRYAANINNAPQFRRALSARPMDEALNQRFSYNVYARGRYASTNG